MPLYFFNVDSEMIDEDRFGSSYRDDDTARGMALRYAAILSETHPHLVTSEQPLRVHITDSDDRRVATITLRVERFD